MLYQAGAQGVHEWTSKVNDSGYAARQAAKLTDNLSGDVERLGGSLSTVLIEGGSGANDVLRFLTQTATGAVNAFGDLPGPLPRSAPACSASSAPAPCCSACSGTVIPRIQEARAALIGMGEAGAKANAALGVIGKGGAVAAATAVGVGCCRRRGTSFTRRRRSRRRTREAHRAAAGAGPATAETVKDTGTFNVDKLSSS
jgi:hypothetical protein